MTLARHLDDRLRCIRKGCDRAARQDSNYCAEHRPPPAPQPPPARLLRDSDVPGGMPLKTLITIAVVSIAAFLWGMPYLAGAIQARQARAAAAAPAVQTFRLTVECRLPQEGEVPIILPELSRGRWTGECSYVAARGSYAIKGRR